jgi:Flavin containing amine oxidoreductase
MTRKSRASPVSNKIAIVGGGIAGLYCLYQLARLSKQSSKTKYQLTLFESTDHVGGRISTHRIYKGRDSEKSHTPRIKPLRDLEFYLEFGTMRLELDQQILLKQLLGTLDINHIKEDKVNDSIEKNKPFLVEFAPFKSEPTRREDVYHTYGGEREQEDGKELLKLALVRIFLAIELPKNPARKPLAGKALEFFKTVNRLRTLLPPEGGGFKWDFLITQTSFSAEHDRWKKELKTWIEELTERDYQNFREFAKLDGFFLYNMGFWNLLSDLMSHNAVSTLSELGTFYHLVPENPNAIEWIIFWLRNLKSEENLKGIYGGMQCIVDGLKSVIESNGVHWDKQVKRRHTLQSILPGRDKVTLKFAEGASESDFDHVILALPYWPLKCLSIRNDQLFTTQTFADLASVFPFPMTKCFVGVKKAWWREWHSDDNTNGIRE